jgi:hypothetical protein
MKKAIGILCITISLASLGWKLSQTYLTIKPNGTEIRQEKAPSTVYEKIRYLEKNK